MNEPSKATVVLITGATGGFGSALGRLLSDEGMVVYGTSRKPSATEDQHPFQMLVMETTDSNSVENCVNEVLIQEGRIDVLVNCVNEMIIGSVEEQTVDEVRSVFDTNVFGSLRVCKAVLPAMRRQRSGTIVNMSSLGGILAVPYMSAYTSAKFALEAMSEALYHEVRRDGIDVVVMQPVAMHMDRPATGSHLRTVSNAPGDSPSHQMVVKMAKDTEASKLTPEMVARRVLKVIRSPRKPLRVPMDKAKVLSLVKRIAPQFVVDRLLSGLVKELKSGTDKLPDSFRTKKDQ